jgi:hypothetical protein
MFVFSVSDLSTPTVATYCAEQTSPPSQEVSAHVCTLFLKKQRKAGEVGSRLLCGRSVFYKLENQGHDLT